MRGPGLSPVVGDAHAVSLEGKPRVHHRPQVVTLALEPVTQRNHLFRGSSSCAPTDRWEQNILCGVSKVAGAESFVLISLFLFVVEFWNNHGDGLRPIFLW